MRASRSIQFADQPVKPNSYGGHTNAVPHTSAATRINTAPHITADAPNRVMNSHDGYDGDCDDHNDHNDHNDHYNHDDHDHDDRDDHNNIVATSTTLSPRLYLTAAAVTKAPSVETASVRPKPTPPGYTSKKALEARAIQEAEAAAEAEHISAEAAAAQAQHLASEGEQLAAEGERLGAEAAAAAAQAAQLASEAATAITINAQAIQTAAITTSTVITNAALTARPPLSSIPFNVGNMEQVAPGRARRLIIPTVAGAEAAKKVAEEKVLRAARAQKAAEMKARKASVVGETSRTKETPKTKEMPKTKKRGAGAGDDGPAKKKARVSSSSKKPAARK